MQYDLAVIGGGPAGYAAALLAAGRNARVAIVETHRLGGVCLHAGCIPSKTLLYSGKRFYDATHGQAYGVTVEQARFDMAAVSARRQKIIETLHKGLAGLIKRAKIDVIPGWGTLAGPSEICVTPPQDEGDQAEQTVRAKKILIATGSSPAQLPIPGAQLPGVLDSTGALALEELHARLVVVGGGVIGCELACFYASAGVDVTVIEMCDEICPALDADVAKLLRTELAKRGIAFHLGATVREITASEVVFAAVGSEELQRVERDVVLLATGRTSNIAGLGLEAIGVEIDPATRGIAIDARCETSVPGVFAAGDVTGKVWLAHAGSRMGEVAAANMLGGDETMAYDAIPSVVYTAPEVACVGLTEAQARSQGLAVKVAKMPMGASGRFLAEHDRQRGLVKLVTDAETGKILGVHLVGGACSEMIFGPTAWLTADANVADLQRVIFPHPTVSELLASVGARG